VNKDIRIGVIYGGRSAEHDVSVRSAETIIRVLETGGYHTIPIAITRSGNWLPNTAPDALRRNAVPHQRHGMTWVADFLAWVDTQAIDVAFPALHGPFGEDGTIQGLLEYAHIPYVGSGVLGSALGMQKVMAKQLAASAGIPVVPWLVTTRWHIEQREEEILREIKDQLGFPIFVKPVSQGSSFGVSRVDHSSQLQAALQLASTYDHQILIERAIPCRELECGVIGNAEPEVSVVGEVTHQQPFFDFRAKYEQAMMQFTTPAPIDEAVSATIRTYSAQIFRVLGLSGLARVDFFLDDQTGDIYFNEVNTMPGFTELSTFPQLWAASGRSFLQICERLIDLAL
jgi:D-alanine-D-alanine ligase